ncbi:hypothetical protein AK830_g8681 [Neonectria ditissima]|uniref:Cystathionine gamma-synthase n=1 Tax=Neonectria ditissima TaxID=78410 RepID=A0A0N8H638_9HYPO|nr:hypothetical protein AK830_g8681 [Neonectria ditissima]
MLVDLGSPLPPGDRHAVSVYLPTWKDTFNWATREPGLLAQMKTGYPRFFVPLIVRELAERLVHWAAAQEKAEAPNKDFAKLLATPGPLALLTVGENHAECCRVYLETQGKGPIVVLHIDFTGALEIFDGTQWTGFSQAQTDIYAVVYPGQLAAEAKAFWQHTGFGISSRCAEFWLGNAPFLQPYGENSNGFEAMLPVKEAAIARNVLRKRIGDSLSTKTNEAVVSMLLTNLTRFLYVDTFKVLSKVYGFDCKLYGHATPSDLDQLEKDLKEGLQISALYTEFPGNPLLGSVDLERLYTLSKRHEFYLVVDDTVATSVNVDLLCFCDVICTSLTKMFSGSCNVMGGSVVLNPKSERFELLQKTFDGQFTDTYFPEDVLVMTKNSADFESRVVKASHNAERVAHLLQQHHTVTQVFYPKGNPTRGVYDRYRRAGKGYGYLLSVRFEKPEAAMAFHDALNVAKGPSLGTNFTLCCAYTLFAHFSELEWAAQYGVVEHLVRISVGIEDEDALEGLVRRALEAATEKHLSDLV